MFFYKFLFFFPDFLKIQRNSFYRFVKYRLGLEFLKTHPFIDLRHFTVIKNSKLNFDNLQNLNFKKKQQTYDFSYEFLTKTNKKLKSYDQDLLLKKIKTDKIKNIVIFFLYKNYKFTKPLLNIKECILLSKTYCCKFYFPIQIIHHSIGFNKIQWIFLGTLPLLTRRGHFIINGAPRTIVNQIVRNPGIYFHKEITKRKKTSRLFYAEIISKRGPWIRIEIDKKRRIWISFQQNEVSRIPISYFFDKFSRKYIDHQIFLYEKTKNFNLKAIIFNEIIWQNLPFNSPILFPLKFNKKNKSLIDKNTSFYITMKKLLKLFHRDHFFNLSKKSQKFHYGIYTYSYLDFFKGLNFLNLNKKRHFLSSNLNFQNTKINLNIGSKTNNPFTNSLNLLLTPSTQNKDSNFTLGKNGRINLNKKLGLSLKTLTLTPIDFLVISDFLFKLINNVSGNKVISIDNIDDLKNRQLKTIGELLENEFARGVHRLKNNLENLFKKTSFYLIIEVLFRSNITFVNFFSLKKKYIPLSSKQTNKKKNHSYKSNLINLLLKKTISKSYKKRSFEKRNAYLLRISFSKKKIHNDFKKHSQFNFSNLHFKRYSIYKEILFYKKPLILQKKLIEVLIKNQSFSFSKESSFFKLSSQPINSVLKEFFHSNQLSQYLDQANPLAEITHKRRLSCLGIGGVNKETAGMEIRDIHPSYYGRICPIETPEGKNAGLVNSLTTGAIINTQKLLETPYTQIYKQHYQNQKKIFFFSVENQENINVFFNTKLPKIKNTSVSIINFKTNNFNQCKLNFINFIGFNVQQFISIATTCIPFIEHNDANRALMGSNMQRQALPLIYIKQPQITTLNSFRVISDLKDIPNSSHSGLIVYISKKKAFLYYRNNCHLNNYNSYLELKNFEKKVKLKKWKILFLNSDYLVVYFFKTTIIFSLSNFIIKNSKKKIQIKQTINFLNSEIHYH